MKSAVKLPLPTLAAPALAGCGADLESKPTALWQSMPSPDPEPMVESWWRLADKGDGLVRVETVESLPESNKADLASVHHDKRYENARSVLVTLAFACDAQRGVAESRVLTSDRMVEGDVLSKASIETGREALPFGGDYIPFADGRGGIPPGGRPTRCPRTPSQDLSSSTPRPVPRPGPSPDGAQA